MRTCGKRRYRTELDAKIALSSAQFKANVQSRREECRAYRCPSCHGWHLTSMRRAA